ncbi:MAE_28990/MAE_18760 family HEPN-like nuclease [Streptomyces althioticus]|uniref:MAE_28990/MAE_18760 family HEPN-like nuclease n=1 Tax=Streptomyces althioticus TaxID=83380 RepID=UPI0036B79336
MKISDLRLQLEEDLAWRLDELRHLRNSLLGTADRGAWEARSMRAILVMQYAHLEGFTRNALSLYVSLVNSRQLPPDDLQPQLLAAALTGEFKALYSGEFSPPEVDGRLSRRVRGHVAFLERLRVLSAAPVEIAAEVAVSMEMNLSPDVLRRNLYMLGIPEDRVSRGQYTAIEFVKNTRNDIAHGSRTEVIPPGLFDAHRKKCEQFMGDLSRIITRAAAEEWFKAT